MKNDERKHKEPEQGKTQVKTGVKRTKDKKKGDGPPRKMKTNKAREKNTANQPQGKKTRE